MAKSLRSNRQKALRRARSQATKARWVEEADARRQAALAKSLASDPEPIAENIPIDPDHAPNAMEEDRGRMGPARIAKSGHKSGASAKIRSARKQVAEGHAVATADGAQGEGMDVDDALASRIQEKLHKLKGGVQKKSGVKQQRKRQVGALHAFEAEQKDRRGRRKKGRKSVDEIRYML